MKDQNTSPSAEKKPSQKACLFVAQISRDCDEASLREYFSTFGEINNVKLLKDRAARPYAFIQFEEEESANKVLETEGGDMMNGHQIRVEKARINCTLFVAKLPRNLSSNGLREMFKAYGQVESASIIKNHHTQKSKGCGFVKFADREDAEAAVEDIKNSQKGLVVEWATSKNDPEALGVDKCNIFVGGLNPSLVEEEALRERFSVYGELESVTLVNRGASDEAEDAKGPSPRSAFAFLRYKEADASSSAIDQENGSEWLDRKIRVQYCESQEMKNKRRAAKGGYPFPNYGGMANVNMYYPGPLHPSQNGMMMMGAWYPPVYPGIESPYSAPYGYPYAAAPWGFSPTYSQMPYVDGGEFMHYQPLASPEPPMNGMANVSISSQEAAW